MGSAAQTVRGGAAARTLLSAISLAARQGCGQCEDRLHLESPRHWTPALRAALETERLDA